MSLLADCFREQMKKSKDYRMSSEAEFDVAYPTGFLGFDFLNGSIVNVRASNASYGYYSVGIVDGSINTLIGRSGCGKTTFGVQISKNIINNFADTCMYIDAVEGGITYNRLSNLTGWDGPTVKERIIYRNAGITAENFYQRLKLIHDLKLANREKLTYDTGKVDTQGNPVYKLVPTPYILDSLAMLMPETYTNENELAGQMAATAAAKTNTRILKTLVPMLKSANIILLLINHINQKVDINPYARTKSQVSYLKPDETLPGGNAAIYLANNIIRFDDTKLKSTEGFCIEGSLVTLSLVKSRTNKAGRTVNLVFCQDTGFDADLSLYTLLKDAGIIKGAGAFYHIAGCETKFTQKTFKDKLKTDPEIRDAFVNAAIDYLTKSITPKVDVDNFNSFEVTNNLIDKLNNLQITE